MKAQTFTAGKFNYTIYYAKGKVVGKDKNFETKISGGGGGGGTYQGTGGTAPISISSRTVIHDKIYLQHEHGKETSIELTDWDVACREGHEMLFAWIIKDKNERGPYVALKNFTTDDQELNSKKIKELADHHLEINTLGSCLLALLVVFSVGTVLYFIGGFTLILLGIVGIVFFEISIRTKSKNAATVIKQQLNQFLDSQK